MGSQIDNQRKQSIPIEMIIGLRRYILNTVASIPSTVIQNIVKALPLGGDVTGPPGSNSLSPSGVTAGTYTGRKYDFTVDAKGRVTAVTDTQCTSWNYQMTTLGIVNLAPSNSYYAPFYEDTDIPICNPAINLVDYSEGALIPPENCTAHVHFYAVIIPGTGWAAAEVIAELWYHNDAGPSENFVCEMGRGYASATPTPPTVVIERGVPLRLPIADGDYYYIRLRQTAAGLVSNPMAAGSYWCFSGHFIDTGECSECEG